MGRGAGVTQCPVPGHALSPSLGSLNDAQAMKVHQEVNCLTDFLDECEEQLQALKKLKKSERGLLYGVPISHSAEMPFLVKGHVSKATAAALSQRKKTIIKYLQ